MTEIPYLFKQLWLLVVTIAEVVANVAKAVVQGVEFAAGPFAGSLFEGSNGSYVWEFLFVTVILGGLAARATGRANALTWQPYLATAVYIVLLACAVRFLHFALFQRVLESPQFYLVDLVILQAIAAWSYNAKRADQMTTQYSWLFERSGSTTWRPRA